MNKPRRVWVTVLVMLSWTVAGAGRLWAAGPALGGFVPLVGIGLTDEFKDPNGLDDTFFIADPSDTVSGGSPLGPGSSAYYDIGILDTGAATHILTQAAYTGFDIANEGFSSSETFPIGTAGGQIILNINTAAGFYAAGLGDRTSAGSTLVMNSAALRGQTSVASLTAPSQWELPNIIGLPMAAQHAIAIRNDDPQIFQYQGRTVRTPQVELRDLGSGGGDIVRRAPLKLHPGESFLTGPLYTFGLSGSFDFIPTSPSVVSNGGLFLDVDMANGAESFADKEFLVDTGADLTVISELTAKRLGFDAVLDTPDFYLEVESPGGVESGVPGIFVDELNIDTIGGSFTLHNVPVAVLDLPNPSDPGNVVDGIIGMNAFNGRNLVIDANPAIGTGGVGPSLYISDPVTETHSWATPAASESWATAANWNAAGVPGALWLANVANVSGSGQTAVVSADSTVFELEVSGTASAEMTVHINSGATLTTFGQTLIAEGGRVELAGGKLDTQFVNIEGGTLAGVGEVFAGTGPIQSPVRNLSGRVEPGDPVGVLTIDGDFSNQAGGTLAVDLGGTTAVTEYDQLDVDRFAFLAGTLEVSLVDLGGGLFAPGIGNAFTIITATGGVSGMFDAEILPAGYQWDVTYGTNDIVLTVIGLGLAGDYNGDGTVDAADYTVWRDTFGQTGVSLAADGDGSGQIDDADYAMWKANFGATSGSGAGAGALGAVPEPAAAVLLLAGLAVLASGGRRLREPAESWLSGPRNRRRRRLPQRSGSVGWALPTRADRRQTLVGGAHPTRWSGRARVGGENSAQIDGRQGTGEPPARGYETKWAVTQPSPKGRGRTASFAALGAERGGAVERLGGREAGHDQCVAAHRDVDVDGDFLRVRREQWRRDGDPRAARAHDAQQALGLGDGLGGRGAGDHRVSGRFVGRVVGRMPNDVQPAELERSQQKQEEHGRSDRELDGRRTAAAVTARLSLDGMRLGASRDPGTLRRGKPRR